MRKRCGRTTRRETLFTRRMLGRSKRRASNAAHLVLPALLRRWNSSTTVLPSFRLRSSSTLAQETIPPMLRQRVLSQLPLGKSVARLTMFLPDSLLMMMRSAAKVSITCLGRRELLLLMRLAGLGASPRSSGSLLASPASRPSVAEGDVPAPASLPPVAWPEPLQFDEAAFTAFAKKMLIVDSLFEPLLRNRRVCCLVFLLVLHGLFILV